ncbi:50S rRNA methyltransferase [Erysipelotrichaceae bacterium]|nr:50S rRNA methyltransferase [Erysipelotrichaceae bacterium]
MLKPSIYSLTLDDLTSWLKENNHKTFRAKQIWKFLYEHKVESFEQMHNIGTDLQSQLAQTFDMMVLEEKVVQKSKDGTIKFLFRLEDGELIETVLMRQKYGNSVCVTTQVGCNIGCSFCASGLLKKQRDLTAGEIVSQIMYVQKHLDMQGNEQRVSHIVIMGIGEPFDNYDNLMKFIRIVNDPIGLAIGARHITVSTSGIVPKIYAFAEEGIQVNLAISLHAPNDEIRTKLMKINGVFPLEKLLPAVWTYVEKTNRRVTFEYIMIDDLNDHKEEALELVKIIPKSLRHMVYVNLIPYNPVNEHIGYKRSTQENIMAFYDLLKKNGVTVVTRLEQGTDIDAACGQLRSKKISKGVE